MNLLLEDESAPVIWRGPIIASVVKQFWTDVMWGDLDYLFVDMPPGTGDVPLTVFQSLPVDGVVIVTSPQDLVQMIVKKAANMAEQMNIPVNVRTAEKRSKCSARAISKRSPERWACRYSVRCRSTWTWQDPWKKSGSTK